MGCLTILGLLGLLLFGGVRLSAVDPAAIASPTLVTVTLGAGDATPVQMLAAAEVLNQRLETFGIADAHVIVSPNLDNRRLIVQFPPVADVSNLISQLTAPGYLELVDLSSLETTGDLVGTLIWTSGQAERYGSEPPEGARISPETLPFPTVIDGTMIIKATATLNQQYGLWLVQIDFDEQGALLLADFTTNHIGDALGIVIDGKVLSAPTIQAQISGGTAVIQGDFTEQEVRDLATQLSSGPLPIRLELLDVQ